VRLAFLSLGSVELGSVAAIFSPDVVGCGDPSLRLPARLPDEEAEGPGEFLEELSRFGTWATRPFWLPAAPFHLLEIQTPSRIRNERRATIPYFVSRLNRAAERLVCP
jgi:hypothetical protein